MLLGEAASQAASHPPESPWRGKTAAVVRPDFRRRHPPRAAMSRPSPSALGRGTSPGHPPTPHPALRCRVRRLEALPQDFDHVRVQRILAFRQPQVQRQIVRVLREEKAQEFIALRRNTGHRPQELPQLQRLFRTAAGRLHRQPACRCPRTAVENSERP